MPGRRRRRVCRNLSLPLLTGLSRRFSAPCLRTQAAGRRESQPESQPESLEGKVLSLLAAGQPMSRLEFSRKLGQKKISGQLNKIIRLLMRERSIEYTLPGQASKPFPEVQADRQGPGPQHRGLGRGECREMSPGGEQKILTRPRPVGLIIRFSVICCFTRGKRYGGQIN